MAFKESAYEHATPEEHLQDVAHQEGKEPFVPKDEYATAEDISAASEGKAELGAVTTEQINKLREDILNSSYATPEQIREASNGMSDKGPVTAEQLSEITAMSAEKNGISTETQEVIDTATVQALNSKLSRERLDKSLEEDASPKKGSGFTKMMNNIRGMMGQRRQGSQDRFNKLN